MSVWQGKASIILIIQNKLFTQNCIYDDPNRAFETIHVHVKFTHKMYEYTGVYATHSKVQHVLETIFEQITLPYTLHVRKITGDQTAISVLGSC